MAVRGEEIREMRQAVFLDKDGTLVEDVPYNVDPERIQLAEGVEAGLRSLHAAGYLLIVISNQSGVARGYFEEAALVAVEEHLRQVMRAFGVPLTGFYYCPHYPTGSVAEYAIACSCRKPEPGLLLQAAQEHDIDLTQSWFIGDILNDVEAGRRAGCNTILIDNGNETEWLLSPQRLPHATVTTFPNATNVILSTTSPSSFILHPSPLP